MVTLYHQLYKQSVGAKPAQWGGLLPMSEQLLISLKLADSFWTPRLHVNRRTMLPTQPQLLEETG